MRRVFASLVVAGTATLAACSLFTSLDGLSGGDAKDAGDGDAGDGDGAGAPADGGSGAPGDSGPSDGGPTAAPTTYLFAAGGGADDAGALTATTTFAPLRPDGTVGAWRSGPPIPVAVNRAGVLGTAGHIHIVGGYTATTPGVSAIATSAETDGGFASFVDSAPLTEAIADTCPVAAGGRAYVITPGLGKIEYATINDAGLGAWHIQGPLDADGSTLYGQAAAVDGQLYWFGWTRMAVAATIAADGSIDGWQPLPPLPRVFDFQTGAVATSRRFVYLVGGYVDDALTVLSSDVYVATVAADGSLGAWTSTEPFPIARHRYNAVASNGYLYVLGGVAGDGSYLFDVSFAKIGADGTLGSWQKTTPLPEIHVGPCSVAVVPP